jgi:hypothetical protein
MPFDSSHLGLSNKYKRIFYLNPFGNYAQEKHPRPQKSDPQMSGHFCGTLDITKKIYFLN